MNCPQVSLLYNSKGLIDPKLWLGSRLDNVRCARSPPLHVADYVLLFKNIRHAEIYLFYTFAREQVSVLELYT